VLSTNNYNLILNELLDQGCIDYEGYGNYFCSSAPEALGLYPNITVYMRGMVFNITAADYLLPTETPFNMAPGTYGLIGLMGGAEAVGLFILGDVFIRKTFVGYSKSNQTIGIANAEGYLNVITETQNNIVSMVFVGITIIALVMKRVLYKRKVEGKSTWLTKTLTANG